MIDPVVLESADQSDTKLLHIHLDLCDDLHDFSSLCSYCQWGMLIITNTCFSMSPLEK